MKFNMSKTLLNFILIGSVALAVLSIYKLKSAVSLAEIQNLLNANLSHAQDSAKSTDQSTSRGDEHNSSKPNNGHVPDEQTAIAIAVAVWTPIYGKKQIEDEKPYKVILKNGIWTVTGSLPEGFEGGTAEAKISQDDGCILQVVHYQ